MSVMCIYLLINPSIHIRTYIRMYVDTVVQCIRIYSEYSLIRCNSFSKNMVDLLDNHWYLYIILVLGNCGRLKGLMDEAVAD